MKNEVESYIYEMRSRINERYAEYAPVNVKE
jgi:hypothetical protein